MNTLIFKEQNLCNCQIRSKAATQVKVDVKKSYPVVNTDLSVSTHGYLKHEKHTFRQRNA